MAEPMLLGVCVWLSDKLGSDVQTLRIVFVIATILGIGTPILIYLILAIIKPKYY